MCSKFFQKIEVSEYALSLGKFCLSVEMFD